MRWYWWAAIIGGIWYFTRKPKALVSNASLTEPQKLGLVKAVQDKVTDQGISNVSMSVDKEGFLVFEGFEYTKPKITPGASPPLSIPVKVIIGKFASPEAVNEWLKPKTNNEMISV
jgi:hypothetical protein